MTPETLQIATLVIAAVAAVGAPVGVIVSVLNRGKIQDIHLSMNSRLTELIAAVKAQAFSDGIEHARSGTADDAAKVLAVAADRAALTLEQAKERT